MRPIPNGAPFHLPLVDHTLPQQVAQTNGTLPLAQTGYDAGPQYPHQINPWNVAASDVFRPGRFNADTGYYDASLYFPYGGIETSPLPMAPMPPAWDFNNIQGFDQFEVSSTAGAHPIPATFPAMVSAPSVTSVPAPAPASATLGRMRCPHGCPATFGRGGEYRRHMRNHEPHRFRCPMISCPKTFSRADKLRDHAKKGHGGHNPLHL
jgi:hypothetical protein